jgi:hypothetical protein
MDLDTGMAETAASEMPSASAIAVCRSNVNCDRRKRSEGSELEAILAGKSSPGTTTSLSAEQGSVLLKPLVADGAERFKSFQMDALTAL